MDLSLIEALGKVNLVIMEEKIRTLSMIFANHFTAQLDTVKLRTGRTTERMKIDHPEAAAVIPFLDEERILMVRQWRYAIGQDTLEIPAGKADPGEDLEICARRELLEETGYEPARVIHLFSYFPAIGYSNEVIRIYAASGLKRLSDAQDMDEIASVETLSLHEAHDLMLEGRIRDGKTVIGLAWFQLLKDRGKIPSDFFS